VREDVLQTKLREAQERSSSGLVELR